jgi:ABC-type transporter Mla MlaB component
MTLKIERLPGKRGIRLRLSGELRSEQIDDVRIEIESAGPRVSLDLAGVDLVDVDAVRFLNTCVAQDVELANCSGYIREWMFQERARGKNSEGS